MSVGVTHFTMQHEEFHDCGGNLDQTLMGQLILSYKNYLSS